MSWRWTLRRVRAMSWGERVLRARRAVRDRAHRSRFNRGGAAAVLGPPPPPDLFLAGRAARPRLADPRRLDPAAWPSAWRTRTLEEARDILAGRFRWLGATHELGTAPSWRTDAVSGVTFGTEHWSAIPVFSADGAADMKHVWEPNLHGAFVTLAKAEWVTGETRYGDHLIRLWKGWMEQNPPLGGPNYLAPVEIGLRLLHWAAAAAIFEARRPLPDALLREIWTHVVYQRATIAHNLSRYSSANNHLIGELAGLVLTDRAFPGLAAPAETARLDRELQREILLQFAPDGGNREQAFHYHAFALAFGLLGLQAARGEGRDWDPRTRERLEAAVGFLDAGLDLEGCAFSYGDSDDSEVLPLADGDRRLYDPIVAHGHVLFGRPQHLPREGDERTAWLCGPIGLPDPLRAGRRDPVTRVFPRSGHAFLRKSRFEVHFNAAPLGYRSIAAHAHADALSVQVRLRGHELVVDPGTHTYRRGDPWRDVLTGTAAHPTVTVDGRNQALRRGPFLWDRHYTATLESDGDEARGAHDGYRGLGVRHQRCVLLTADAVRVDDVLHGKGRHHVRVCWPFAPGRVRFDGGAARIGVGDTWATVTLEGLPAPPRFETGSVDDPGSPCVAPAYDTLLPASALVWEGELELPASWTTWIRTTVEKTTGS